MKPVRIALGQRFQPQDFPWRGVRDHDDDDFLAIHSNHRLVLAWHGRASARAAGLFAARASSRFLDVAPRAHARDRDDEGGEEAARGARRQSKRPRERNPRASAGSVRRGLVPPGNA